mgnify:CR=1 FL=1
MNLNILRSLIIRETHLASEIKDPPRVDSLLTRVEAGFYQFLQVLTSDFTSIYQSLPIKS